MKLTRPVMSNSPLEDITSLDQRERIVAATSCRVTSGSDSIIPSNANRQKMRPPAKVMALKMCNQRSIRSIHNIFVFSSAIVSLDVCEPGEEPLGLKY